MSKRNLVSEGYSVKPCPSLFSFFVERPDGTKYRVNPVEAKCTCRAAACGLRCCHLAQVGELICHFWITSSDAQDAEAARLMADWQEVRGEVDPTYPAVCFRWGWDGRG
jgi:hypothetical protein